MEHKPAQPDQVIVIGGGPAGLTAAYELVKRKVPVTVLEATDMVGGISRTEVRDGWRFDIGGHRFFTKVAEVEALWHEILPGEDFMVRPRMSRILFRGKKYDYPLKASNALGNLGLVEAARCVGSYALVQVKKPAQDSFEGWVSARFGRRLYRHFFKTYTEKVWGVPADQMPADWAAQRIKNLNLFKAAANALMPKRNQTEIASLIEEFEYPKYGPGMMWERCRDKVVEGGGKVVMNAPVTRIIHDDQRATSVVTVGNAGEQEYPAAEVISSMPLRELVLAMDPPAPEKVVAAAKGLGYRDFLTVAVVVPKESGFPDNWIYIHDANVKVGRIQNFGAWSPYMIQGDCTCLGMEYFVNEGDEYWTMSDADLGRLATREIEKLGLVEPGEVRATYVVRVQKAYPVYDTEYKANVETIKTWLAASVPNVHPVGRNGMHRYNNQDHSMLTAMETVENIVDGTNNDVWSVNVEEEYHEEGGEAGTSSGTGRDAPITPRPGK